MPAKNWSQDQPDQFECITTLLSAAVSIFTICDLLFVALSIAIINTGLLFDQLRVGIIFCCSAFFGDTV